MLETYLKDLEEVVNIDCGSNTCDGVTRVAEIMKRHYDEIGFATELVDLGDKAGRGLFATNKPGAEKFDIMFNAHLDTVYPDGTVAQRPFRVEDGTVYGPGCADCKAGVIAIFHALKNARKEDLDRLAIAVCYNPDEEVSSLSSREWLATMAKKAMRAVVSEPGRASGAFVRSRKGRSSGTSPSTALPLTQATTRRTAAPPFSPPPGSQSKSPSSRTSKARARA